MKAQTAAAAAARPSTRAASAATAAAKQPPPPIPMSSTIQALRTIFRSLTDSQFTTEVEMERQRRGCSLLKKKTPASAAAAKNTRKKKKRAASAEADNDVSSSNNSKRQKTNTAADDSTASVAAAAAANAPEHEQQQQQLSPLEPSAAKDLTENSVGTATLQNPDAPPAAVAAAVAAAAAASPPQHQLALRRRTLHNTPVIFDKGLLPQRVQNIHNINSITNDNNSNKKSSSHDKNNHRSNRKDHHTLWEDNYRQLTIFRQTYGHINVPCTDPNYAALYRWMSKQKIQWRDALQGKSGIMTEARIKRLLAVGLTLQSTTTTTNNDGTTSTIKAGPSNLATVWEEKYLELCNFHKQHGHVDVPRHINKDNVQYQSLARWCDTQRSNYKNRMSIIATGKKCCKNRAGVISGQQVDLLTKIGFQFSKRFDFTYRFQQISNYKALHGDTRVPVACKEFDNLGQWVANQKKLYHAGRMQPDRIQLLQTIGFDFSLRCAPNGGYRNNHQNNNNNDQTATSTRPQSPGMDVVGI